MQHQPRWRTRGRFFALTALAGTIAAFVISGLSCTTAPTAFLVNGPGQTGDVPPTLQITSPTVNISRGQGDPFLIAWTDSDSDSNAQISFSLVNTETNAVVPLVQGIDENDQSGPDDFTVLTRLIPIGSYNILGIINDGVNPPVSVFAMTVGPNSQRVVVQILREGEGQQTEPPVVVVTAPVTDLSVTQDDPVTIVVQPVDPQTVPPTPFDADSDITLYIVLDTDLNPTNDDPANPQPGRIVVLVTQKIETGVTAIDPFTIAIDLTRVPPRPNGEPYFIRATVDDATNRRVHSYAPGTISVVQLAAGTVDLSQIGRSLAGALFLGFNPGANVGSTIRGVQDFDNDGTDDFVIVAQFGNSRGGGPEGEAYLIYGQNGVRFGGISNVNSVSSTISGVVFEAPPVRISPLDFSNPPVTIRGRTVTDGITDVNFLPDLTGDGRPELIFGLGHVVGAIDTTDWDPADEDSGTLGCFPDFLPNNLNDPDNVDALDIQWFAGGMVPIVHSQNRDLDPAIDNSVRLDNTTISLELVGQRVILLERTGINGSGAPISATADNSTASNLGNETAEPQRISGTRIIAGPFDYIDAFDLGQPARDDRFGESVSFLGDVNNDTVPEIMISAPTNEAHLGELDSLYAGFSTHLLSTSFPGSITVIAGANYNQFPFRDKNDPLGGTSMIPIVGTGAAPPACDPNPVPRFSFIPHDVFSVFAEDIGDRLGGARSAGDFNQDSLDDIIAGAYLNDRSVSIKDSGAVYVLYSRSVFRDYDLKDADNPTLRPPMLRIRGRNIGDQLGWRQGAALDVNGDRINDVIFSAPRADFGGITRTTCAMDFSNDGLVGPEDLQLSDFNGCENNFGDEVFTDDACKAFDYDNDGDIDNEDRCVFCCLSDGCDPDNACVFGREANCCANLVDNGVVGVVFGGRLIDGDRDLNQLGTTELPGAIFFGGRSGHRAGVDISAAGDFNQDGFGDILIAVPGEVRVDDAGRQRLGIVYLVFGGPHLENTRWNLSDPNRGVGSDELPGIVFLSPFVAGRPNEAAPTSVGYLGDINNDGFQDIAIGNPKADFIDLSFPQGPDAPGSDPAAGRRSNAGNAYIIYGNNFGSNRANP